MKKYCVGAGLAVLCVFFGFQAVHAAVSNATTTAMWENQPNNRVRASDTIPAMRFDLYSDAGETLNSITVTIASSTNASPTAVASSSLEWVGIAKDENADGVLSMPPDALLATTTANIGTPLTIDVSAATTTPATGTFFFVFKTSGAWTDNGVPETGGATVQQIVASIAASGIVTSGGTATTTATTTQPFTADIHSQVPATSTLSAFYQSGSYKLQENNGQTLGEQGTLSVWADDSTSTPMLSASLGSTGHPSGTIDLGSTYRSSVWLSLRDVAGNATSTRAEYTLPTAPTVTSFGAYTDRIIMNFSKNLRGDQATYCSNYLVNGTAPTCTGGPGSSYIDFYGNKLIIKNLALTGTVSLSVAGLVQDTAADQFPLSFSTSSVPVQALTLPTVTALSASAGAVGSSVTLTGTNFGSATGTVAFSGGFDPSTGPLPPVEASTTAWSNTSITATVPSGASGGPITVITSDGVMSDISEKTFFDVSSPLYVKLALSATSSPITSSVNMRIFIGNQTGEHVYYDGDGATTFNGATYVYTIPNVSSMGGIWAYDASGTKLPSVQTQISSGTTSSSPMILLMPNTTTRSVSGTVTLGSSCADAGRNKLVAVIATPQGSQVTMGPGGAQPSFFTTDNSCQTSYAIALASNGIYQVEAHLPPSASAGSAFLAPSGKQITISDGALTATNTNFTFTTAANSIYGKVVDGDGNALAASKYTQLWVHAYQPVENGMGTATNPNSSGYFRLYVSPGSYKVGVGGPEMPSTIEQDLVVTDTASFAAGATSTVITIKLEPPTTNISGSVKDGSGNGISGVDLFGWCASGPGGGHAVTDAQGVYTMYVSPCSDFHISGFAQGYGKLTEQSGITVSQVSNPTVNFTLSSTDFATISGTVTQNGSALSGADVWVTQGDFGPGIGGGRTDTSGAFSFKIRKGLSGLYVHTAVMGRGEIAKQQLASGGTVSSDQTGISLSSSVATLEIRLKPKNTFSDVFVGAHSNLGAGFTNTKEGTGADYDIYRVSVPYSGTTSYTVDGGIPSFGPLPSQTVSVSGNTNVVIDLSSIPYYTVSGTVSGDYTDAFVWAGGSAGGGGTRVNNADGTFTMKLREGTYDIGVNKPGYIGSVLASQNIATTTAGLSLSLTQSGASITGTATYNGAAVQNVRVWAESSGGGWADAFTDVNGQFTLYVSAGAWTMHARGDGYELSTPFVVTAPASGVSVVLSSVAFTAQTQNQSMAPTQGGILQTSNIKIEVPAGALGSGSSNVQVSVTDTMSVPDRKGTKVIGNGKDISATYASGSNQGQSLSNLSNSVSMEFVLTKAELVSGGITNLDDAKKISIGYDDRSTNSWVQIPTTVILDPVDATWGTLVSVTLKGSTTHFSSYAPILPTSGSAPDTPTGLSAAPAFRSITLSWTASSGAAKYYIYRKSGSDYPYFAQTTSTSYTDSGLSDGRMYYYKVSALDASDNESAATGAVDAMTITTGGGGGGGSVTPAPTPTPTPTPVSSSTASSSLSIATPTPSPISGASGTSKATPGFAFTFAKRLVFGMSNDDVRKLQQFLAQDKDVYPDGRVTGYFGVLTRQAVQAFQRKYNIAKSGDVGYGTVGPATRSMLNQLVSGASVPSVSPVQTSVSASVQEQIQVLQEQLKVLLNQLVLMLQQQVQTLKGQ